MSELETSYRNLEDWEKVEFLINLEFEAPDGKWGLIENIIKDTQVYDLARIQALKILEIAEIPASEKTKIAETLEQSVINDEDYDVQNYASVAIKNFMEFKSLEELAEKIVIDKHEDIDIRHNAFAAILKVKSIDRRKHILNILLEDPEFQKSATRNLNAL